MNALTLTLLLGLTSLLAAVPAQAQKSLPIIKAEPPADTIRLRSGQLPLVGLTPDILYRILVAEVAASRGEFDVASQTFLGLARDTSDPRFAQSAFQYSMADRNLPRALRAAKEWALLAPQDPEAKATALALEASNGQTEGLADALWIRISRAQDKEQAIVQAMGIVSKMVDRRLALEVLDKALREPVRKLPIAHLALADTAWNAEDPVRAEREAREALRQDPHLEAAAQRVLEYGIKVDPSAALDSARRFVRDNPDSRKLQLLLANRLVERQQFDEALAIVADLQRAAPEDFDLLYTQAEIHTRAKQYDDARRLLEEYINVQQQRRQSLHDDASTALASISEARLSLVQIAEAQGDLNEAIRQLDLIEEPGLRFQAQVHKAVLQARQGNLPQARRTLEASRPRDRNDQVVVALTYSSIYQDSGRTDQALETLERADRELPDSAEIKYNLAMLYEQRAKTDQFETLMRRVIELRPDNANAYNALGYTFADQNRNLEEAQDLLERAMELEPDNPYILDSVGWYLFRIGDLQAALEYLQRSYEKLPEADVAAHLGEVLWAKGRRNDAMLVFRAGLAKDAQNRTLLETIKRLGVVLP
ncbi:tetratricopeptide repeat protein [Alcaligenes sp. WGS1538]|uniref:tetratricopeptide repeat protein n=1 Tax=Alcaligenes sp. WGS1538 TaxID=3366811 RepID=UPI00372CE869